MPQERLSSINIDGDLSDWQWMDPSFRIDLDEFQAVRHGRSRRDFDVRCWVAWSGKTNMLYHAIEVADDRLYTPAPAGASYAYDVVKFYIDPDDSGGSMALRIRLGPSDLPGASTRYSTTERRSGASGQRRCS